MGFKMKGSAFKLGNIATKSTLKMKSPLEQVLTGFEFSNPEGSDPRHHPQYSEGVINPKKIGYFRTTGRGKNKRFDMAEGLDRNKMLRWIRETKGRSAIGDPKARRKAEIEYYNLYKPKEKEVKEEVQEYTGEAKEKETKYPTNKDIQPWMTSTKRSNIEKHKGKEVWDETVNNGKGGYVRVDPQGIKEYEEGFNPNPTSEEMVIPEEKGYTLEDPFADAPYERPWATKD